MRYIVLSPLTPNHPFVFDDKQEAVDYYHQQRDIIIEPDYVQIFTVTEFFPKKEEELLASHKCVNHNA